MAQTTELLTNSYVYDSANRLTSVDGVTYSYDNNGNLLSDGTSTNTYNHANRLTSVTQGGISYNFVYNGLGDRLQQTVDTTTTNYTLDLNNRLTQVLTDGTDTYLYGLGRIGEFDGTDWTYPLADALGSVRQLTDASGAPVMAQNYAPYGDVLESYGAESSNYGYAGEWTDGTGLQYLRARYLNTGIGRFITRDTWGGDAKQPMSYNAWLYGYANPIFYVDPSGFAATAEERLDEIILEVAPNGAEALFRTFEDSELYNKWGHVAGKTLGERLKWLLDVTLGLPPSFPIDSELVALSIGAQFAKHFGSDCGFAEDYRDSQFYTEWGLDPGESNQVGHFLSAVSLTYRYIIIAENIKNNGGPSSRWEAQIIQGGENALALIIGHEQVSDKNMIGQLGPLDNDDVDLWYAAVELDAIGHYEERDQKLWDILNFNASIPFESVSKKRQGNSIQDLRLSLKGYRFAKYVWDYPALNPGYGGSWLRSNLGSNLNFDVPYYAP